MQKRAHTTYYILHTTPTPLTLGVLSLFPVIQAQPSDRHIIGCFSAASNVTGQLVDTTALSVCLHEHGALACFDFATAGKLSVVIATVS